MTNLSHSSEVVAFLPCREGSKRIPQKNIRTFHNFENGLLEIKLSQLIQCPSISKVVLSSDDFNVINYATSLHSPKVFLDKRPEYLCSDTTTTDELIEYASNLFSDCTVLWTHTTSPFCTSEIYEYAIYEYFKALNRGFDSLMSSLPLRSFIWDSSKPVNYNKNDLKWPLTQSLPTFHLINSAIFLASSNIYQLYNDRIGFKPFYYELSDISAIDIDWPSDFSFAEKLLACGIANV